MDEDFMRTISEDLRRVQNDIPALPSINTVSSLHQGYDSLLAGYAPGGRMSSVRRFFCMFVTFDLLLTGLMWLICIMLNGENIMDALNQQVRHYHITSSLFDVVLSAISRFVILLLFYGLVSMNHWIIVALTTTFTCIFLITKVFYYDWKHASQPVFEVLMVLVTFVLSWGEAWFLDFRVVPQEMNARQFLISNQESERAPIIQNYINGLPSCYTESMGNFQSVMNSPEGSLYRVDAGQQTTPVAMTKDEVLMAQTLAALAMEESWSLLNCTGWTKAKSNKMDTVYSMTTPKMGKIFKVVGMVECSPRYLFEELFYRVHAVSQWNPDVLESYKALTVDEHTDICYQISADAAGGMVKSRDFVTLRNWHYMDGRYVIAMVGTEHPSIPVNPNYIRGINGFGCMAMHEDIETPERCLFQWIFNTNLNGWIPPTIRDAAFLSMMLNYMKNLRIHIAKSTNNRQTRIV